MFGPISDAALFLINTVFQLYLYILAARLILAFTHADYFNPLIQFVIRMTDPIVKPLKRFIPNLRGIELSTLTCIILLEIIKFAIAGLIQFGMPNILGLIVLAFADSAKLLVLTFFYAIFLQVILSWIHPPGYSPVGEALFRITAPIMRPLQRYIPHIGGFDITPIPALILLQLIIILFINPLLFMGMQIAFG